jgi:hypothetical protein
MKRILLLISLVLFSISVFSQTRESEKYYQLAFADIMDGKTEVVLSDRTRVDVETDTHVFEVDFASKWAESIGQSLHYQEMTGKQAGVLLVMKGTEEERFLERLMRVAAKHGIDVWVWDYVNNTCERVEVEINYKY